MCLSSLLCTVLRLTILNVCFHLSCPAQLPPRELVYKGTLSLLKEKETAGLRDTCRGDCLADFNACKADEEECNQDLYSCNRWCDKGILTDFEGKGAGLRGGAIKPAVAEV